MKSKIEKKLIICIIIIILVIVAFVTFLLINKSRNNNNSDNNITNNENSNDNTELVAIPEDEDLDDNNQLIGNWNSIRTEIYTNDELTLSFGDTTDKNLQIYSSSGLKICYIAEGNLNCTDGNYSYINNKMYIDVNTYMNNESEVILEDDNLIFKSYVNDTDYSLLYFEKN